MNVEEARLRTFADWPGNAVVDASELAAAGFFSLGTGLRVKCYSCDLEISNWEPGDVPIQRHRELRPYCMFAAANLPSSDRTPSQQNGRENAAVPPGQPTFGRWVTTSSVYKNEQARLDSFSDWPIAFIVRPEALAAAGFFFLKQGDKVACAFCTGMIERWERGDVPKEEHRRHFPNCPFLLGLPVGNVPRVCDASRFAELGIQPHRGPRYPKFSTVESRLRTFTASWPPSVAQKPSDLAQAGFFHESKDGSVSAEDQVRCFHCDGGLRHWEPPDTPWKEHARWFPTCPFLLLVKGQHFVDNVQAEFRDGAAALLPPPPPPVPPPSPHPSSSSSASSASPLTLTEKSSRGLLPSGLSSSMPSLSETDAPLATTSSSGSTEAVGESLEEENRRLKDARVCKICMDQEIGTVLLPCGHFVACVGCAPSLLDCPVCRVTIKATVRTYLS